LTEKAVPGSGTHHQFRSGMYDTYNKAQVALERLEKDLDVAAVTVPVEVENKP
jgi:hypothetical protein